MAGITSYGAYVPFNRLSRDEVARAWGRPSAGGEKAVVNFDEDSVTIGVSAALDCLTGMDKKKIGSLYLATTTSPYKEKQAATIMAMALDLAPAVRTADVTDSLKAGTTALGMALDAVKAGTVKDALVVATDCRLGLPQSDFETWLGDGAAAFTLGDTGVIASIEDSYAVYNEFLDQWRSNCDTMLRSWEDRIALMAGYTAAVRDAVTGLLKKNKLAPKDIGKVVIYAPNLRSHGELVRALGFDPKTQVQDPLLSLVGNTGTAMPLMMLVAALEQAKPGELILLAGYGDGADAYILKVTEEIKKLTPRLGVKGHLARKKMLSSYEKYLTFQNLVPFEEARLQRPPMPSATVLWRRRKEVLSLYGVKCKSCGTTQYPPQRVCVQCQAKDNFDEYVFADKQGQIFTFCLDYVTSPSLDPPTAYCWVDFDGGARIVCPMTDFVIDEIKVGMPVQMTFRKFPEKASTAAGMSNYFWKCTPVRKA